ncbi:MAG: hypothetical protein ACRCYY_00660 [Trueperaceae bacterium]
MSMTLKAKFDGEKILLEEPYPLKPGVELLVVVPESEDEERRIWLEASAIFLGQAFDGDEPEYTTDMIKVIIS